MTTHIVMIQVSLIEVQAAGAGMMQVCGSSCASPSGTLSNSSPQTSNVLVMGQVWSAWHQLQILGGRGSPHVGAVSQQPQPHHRSRGSALPEHAKSCHNNLSLGLDEAVMCRVCLVVLSRILRV